MQRLGVDCLDLYLIHQPFGGGVLRSSVSLEGPDDTSPWFPSALGDRSPTRREVDV
jgi:aryl-alcohol dehydrogenase-like predicted oxidoreductase